jgi:acyl-CoA synthetase (AMP-forming)/AMP-acid ligase II
MVKITSYEQLIHKGSPFELQDMVVGGVPCKVFPRGPQTLRDVFIKAASFADREFIIKGDTRLTFGQAFRRGNHFALSLRQKYNIKKGSRVALIMETCPEWAIAFMSFFFADAVPVVVPAAVEGRDMADALELTNCELAVADLPSAGKIRASGMKLPVAVPVLRQSDAISYIGATSGFSIFNMADAPDDKNNASVSETCGTAPDDEALISFTSGTTGKPRGVIHSHRNLTTGLMNMMLGGFLMSFRAAKTGRRQPHDAQPCSLLVSPFSHIGGYSHLMLMSYLGGKIVLMPEWNTQRAAALIESERVRSLNGLSPAQATDLLRANQSTNSMQTLTSLNIHGIALHRKFIRELADEFPHISLGTGYGMTETCGAVSMASGMELLDNPEFSGRALPGVNIKIVDNDGREAARGDYGEIWVRGAMVMRGYCSGQDGSRVALEDGWLKTGDLGCVDHEGNLSVAGRIDTLKCGKKQVSSGALERLVCKLNAVDEAAALSLPDSGYGASVVVAVIPNGVIRIDKNELKREVSSCVRKYADDIRVILMNDFPRTASGKADRRALQLQLRSKYVGAA